MAAFRELADHSVVVFVDGQKQESGLLNPLVCGKLHDPNHGRTIPWASTFSPDLDKPWGDIKHGEMEGADAKKAYRGLQTKVKTKLAEVRDGKPATADTSLSAFEWHWSTNEAGRHYRGKFVGVTGDKLTLITDGQEIHIDKGRLSPLSWSYAQKLAGQPATPAGAGAAAASGPESWKNADGKEISATFVKLEGEDLSLKLASGKVVTLKVGTLAAASQTRARELGK